MRKALKKLANNAACTTNQFSLMVEVGKTYEGEDRIHLFEPFFLMFAVDDLHSCGSRFRQICCDVAGYAPSL